VLGVVLLLLMASSPGCRRGQTQPPADAVLDAIRADERAGGLSYGEGQGKRLFAQYCSTCHGDEGKGDGQNASNLNPAPPDLTSSRITHDAALLRRVITQGSAAAGRSPLSPPWGRSLSAQHIDYLVEYCEALGRTKPQNGPGGG
jgi:mono/diheme cytochrome c family protein